MCDDMFRPPINRAMRTLDRSFFQKKVPISAARIYNNQHISQCRKELEKSGDMLALERIATVRPDPVPDLASGGRRCLLLRPEIKHHGELPQAIMTLQVVLLVLTALGRLLDLEPESARAGTG